MSLLSWRMTYSSPQIRQDITDKRSEETGKTIRVDFLFTLKFDEAGKLKIVKTQQLSEEESRKYRQDSQN